jgi:hypothetical protein
MIGKHFLPVIKMGHDQKPSRKLCWTKDDNYRFPFCSSVMSRDHYLTILTNLHFADTRNPTTQDSEDPDYDRL